MANRVDKILKLRSLSSPAVFHKGNILPSTQYQTRRSINQTSAPSQAGLIHMNHLNPDMISKIEKQIAAQGNQN